MFLVTLVLFPQVSTGTLTYRIEWIPQLGLNLTLRMDGLAWLFSVLITLIGFVAMLLRAIRVAHLGRYAASVWPLGLLVFLVAANVGEAPFLAHKNIYWVLYAATATSLWYQPRAGGGRRQPAPRGRLPGRAAAPVGDVRARPG